MFSRFSKSFLLTTFVLFIFTTIFLYHSSENLDPWSNSSVFSKDLDTDNSHSNQSELDDLVSERLKKAAAVKNKLQNGNHPALDLDLHGAVTGGVITDKLVNETTK